MKNIKLYIVLLFAILVMSSCDPDEFEDLASAEYQYVGVVSQRAPSLILEGPLDGGNSVNVPLQYDLGGTGSIDITFTVTGSAKLGTDFTVVGANISGDNFTVSISGDTTNLDVVIQTIGNFEESTSGNKSFVATITGTPEGVFAGTPLSGSFSMDIVDDDCFIDIDSDWSGSYTVEEVFSAGSNAGLTLASAFGETYAISLERDPSDASGTSAIITNLPGNNTYFTEGEKLIFLTCDSQVAFGSGTPEVALFDLLSVGSSSYGDGVITIVGDLGAYGEYTIKLIRD